MTNPSRGPSLLQARDPHSFAHSLPHSSSSQNPGQREKERPQDHSHSFHRHLGRHQHANQHAHARAPTPERDSVDSDHDHDHFGLSSSSLPSSPAQGHLDQNDKRHHGDQTGLDDHLQLRQAPASSVSTNAVASSSPSLVTQVVQTVSLVQFVDSSGSPIATQTRYATPNTIVVDSASGKTVAISHPDPSRPAAPGPGSDDPAPSPTDSGTDTVLSTPAQPSHSLSESESDLVSASATSQDTALTSAPSPPNASIYPTMGGMHNGTNPGNSTFMATSDGSAFRQMDYSTPVTLSDTTVSMSASMSASASASDSTTDSSWSYSISDTIISSSYATGTITTSAPAFSSIISTSADASEPTSTSTSDDTIVLSPQQKQVIGGVVGGVAGAALFVFLVMLALRYKRRRDGRATLGDGSSGTVTAGSGNGSGAPSGNTMVESSGPAAITAAWAGLVGKRNAPASASAGTGERGFYRVSGRKLPSVFQAGGDGYTDPRASVMSGNSDYYRGSQSFDPVPDPSGAGGSARLALGSPMRPVSGIPIMRSGPARTPITEQNPFADPPSPPKQDSNDRDMRSRGSPMGPASRFQEGI